jgi:pilus assembly protein CpaE
MVSLAPVKSVSSDDAPPMTPVAGERADAKMRETVRIPRIAIHVFCESPDVAAAAESAAQDRMMARARITVHRGGIAAAAALYRDAPTPNLIVLESRSSTAAFFAELEALAEVCDLGTKVMAIGYTNDISFYRELMRRGISEYLLAPVSPVSLIHAVSAIYGEAATEKLGQTVAFIGVKGGVGSSTLAHNVGWMIGRNLRSNVILADMDLPFGTASLDFNIDAGMGVADAIQDAGRLDEVLLDRLIVKCGDHLSLLRAPASLDRCYDLDPDAITPLIEVAQESAPFMILDMPHLWTAWARNVLVAADEIIVTAIPDLANLRNAKSMLAHLRQARPNDPPPKFVLNQVGMPKRPEISPKEFAKALQLEPLACIPFDAHLFGTAANKGQMLADVAARSAAVRMIGQVADAITARKDSKRSRKPKFELRSLVGKIKRSPKA